MPPRLLSFELDNQVTLHLRPSDRGGKLPGTCKVSSKLFRVKDGRLVRSEQVELKLHPMLEYDMPDEGVARMINPYATYWNVCYRDNAPLFVREFALDIEVLLEDGTRLRIESLPFEVLLGPRY